MTLTEKFANDEMVKQKAAAFDQMQKKVEMDNAINQVAPSLIEQGRQLGASEYEGMAELAYQKGLNTPMPGSMEELREYVNAIPEVRQLMDNEAEYGYINKPEPKAPSNIDEKGLSYEQAKKMGLVE